MRINKDAALRFCEDKLTSKDERERLALSNTVPIDIANVKKTNPAAKKARPY